MTGNYKILKTVLLLSCLFRVGHLQTPTFASISQNFCQNLNGIVDNLSCPEATVETGDCFNRNLLCDGTQNCADGADEGVTISSLECNFATATMPASTPMFDCGLGILLPLAQLCDGVDNCGDASARSGDDETLVICDNKCLAPYYGECDVSRMCENSRNGVNCGNCFEGFVEIAGSPVCGVLTIEAGIFTEGVANPVEVCATLSSPAADRLITFSATTSVTIDIAFVPGSAIAADYNQLTTSLTFNDATRMSCISFNVVDDIVTEPTESFTISATQVGSQVAIGSVTILDNDMPIVGFTLPAYTGSEATPTTGITATVSILNGITSNAPISVSCIRVALSTGTTFATPGADFNSTATMVTILAGQVSVDVNIPLIDDLLIEDTEMFSLQLQNPSSGTISDTAGTATATIIDNDNPVFGLSPTMATQLESDQSFQISIIETSGLSLGPGISRPVVINSQTAGLAQPATPGLDFVNVPSTMLDINVLPFPFTYTLIDDTLDEPAEMFNLFLSAQPNTGVTVDSASNTATITITDNDLTIFTFSMNPVMAAEGMSPAMVCVQLVSGSPSAPVTLTLTPTPGSASALDFSNAPMMVTFPANSVPPLELCAAFAIVDDDIQEVVESFSVAGSGGTFQGANPGPITVSIADNDNAIVEFTQQLYNAPEGAPPTAAGVRLAAGSATLSFPVTVVVNSQVTSQVTGSAQAVSDFTPIISQTLTFMAGDAPGATVEFDLPIIDDLLVEGLESFQLVGTATGATFANNDNTADVQITDNDVLEVGFQLQSYTVIEANDQMVCLAVMGQTTLAPGVTVTATVGTQPGTATANLDYDPIPEPNMVMFMAGTPFLCVNLDIVDDNIDEQNEQFLVTATPGSGLIQIPDTSSDVIIVDDDIIVVQFSEPRYSVSEGDPNGVEICVDITAGIVGAAGLVINVMDTVGGNATLGEDYNAINQALTFPPGATPGINDQECFIFFPINDNLIEFKESVVVMASSDDPEVVFTMAGNEAVIDICDNDMISVMIVPPPGQVGPPTFIVPEDGGPLEVCVMVVTVPGQAVLGRPVSVVLSTVNGTAIGAAPGVMADFCTESFTITFQPGQEDMEICNDILINNDMVCEGDETFSLVLESGPDGGSAITNSPGMATIIDDDVAMIRTENSISIPENIGVFDIPLLLVGQKAPGRQCAVTATTMDGTAISIGMDRDYVGIMNTTTLDSSMPISNVEIEIVDDGRCEGMEQFQVFLATSSDGCAIDDDSSPITVTIMDDEIGSGGDDPHFSIVLPSGRLLCYTVQGEHGFSFNLISNKKMTMNARFVPDSRRNEVTWMGSMGIVVRDSVYKQSNATALRFEAIKKKVYIGDKVELAAKNIERMTFKNGKLIISEAPPTDKFKYPSIYVDLQDVEISFTMKFLAEHLDIFWHRTGGKIPDSHGIIGQFFRTGVEIDEVRKILIMPNKEPVPVMRRPVWSFMEREKADDQLCWTAMNPGYQGEGLIDGTYFDYLVDDVMTSEFEFKKKQ